MSPTIFYIELAKATYKVVKAWRTIQYFEQSIERAKRGEEPFATGKLAQMLRDNRALSRRLQRLTRSGPPEPEVPIVAFQNAANPKTRGRAVQQLRQGLRARLDDLEIIVQNIKALEELRESAAIRAQAASAASVAFLELAKLPIPVPTTAIQASWVSHSQNLSALGGSIRSVRRDAIAALDRLYNELRERQTEVNNLQNNLGVFFGR